MVPVSRRVTRTCSKRLGKALNRLQPVTARWPARESSTGRTICREPQEVDSQELFEGRED
jgi:hypothetical protein